MEDPGVDKMIILKWIFETIYTMQLTLLFYKFLFYKYSCVKQSFFLNL
jgi:hypothetical protein